MTVFTSTNPVAVGQGTLKSHYDTAFNNTLNLNDRTTVLEGSVAYARKTTSQNVISSTVLVNVTDLTFAVAASETWVFWFVLHGTTDAAAQWKFAVTFPTAPTNQRYGLISQVGISGGASSTGTAGAAIVADSLAAEEFIIVSGLLINGANAGNVQLQYAQRSATAVNTTIRADSFVRARRIS